MGLGLLALVAAALAYVWLTRERIATDLIDDYLAEIGLEANYEIVQIGLKRQIIENVVIGDPQRPDATIRRVIVDVSYGLGAPGIGAARLESPRIFATYRGGEVSLGALDPLLFSQSDAPSSGLPGFDVAIVDGGALLETDYGDVGLHLEGQGPLADGFSGRLALVAPDIGVEDCLASALTAYGELTTLGGEPRFTGPVRLREATCAGAELASADVAADISADAAFTRASGDLDLVSGTWRFEDNLVQSGKGLVRLSISEDALVLAHDLTFSDIETGLATLSAITADGTVRSAQGFSQTTWDAQVRASEVDLASDADRAIAQAREASEGTLVASLLTKFERNLEAATRGASLSADVTYRLEGDAQSLVIPEARLRSGAGETVLAISRLAWGTTSAGGEARLSGNFLTGGAGLPEITGRMDQDANGAFALRMSMAQYAQGEDRLAIPGLQVRQNANGPWLFSGKIAASGAIPGGKVASLEAPLEGAYSQSGGLRLGSRCADIRVAEVAYYDLALEDQAVRVCPASRRAMISYNGSLDIDVAAKAFALSGDLAGSPVRMDAAQAKLNYPGGFDLTDLSATIGEPDNAVHLTSAALSGGFEEGLAGTFENAAARLDAVPLDVSELAGRWSFSDGSL
ncbi:MAG: hypothetical protein AAFY81_05585, partial [Pseudomonadota bacterium]